MTTDPLLDRIDQLNVWQRRGERAPHKPLLLLLALGRLVRGDNDLPFAQCEDQLTELLREFGPTRRSHHPEYPFWRLQNDGLWEVSTSRTLASRKSNTDPPKSQLRRGEAVGSFPDSIRRRLTAEPDLVREVAQRLLDGHFPETLHSDILDAVGLSLDRSAVLRQPRDPQFRTKVLVAYQYRCAVCRLDLRLGSASIGLEAAHIRWRQAGGPDIATNGIALCALHHKIFDLGAFTIHHDHRVLVSEQAHGGNRFEDVLLRHHGEPLQPTVQPDDMPASDYLRWHRREVFKERPRSN